MLIGHENLKKRVNIAVTSAKYRNKALPHTMLTGSAGCGKTSTALWLSELGGYDFLPAAPLSLKNKNDVYKLLERLNSDGYNECGDRVGEIRPTILFFDEIHRLSVIAQEILGVAMERFVLEAEAANKYIWLPYFTLVGATTDEGLLTKPFRDRFKLVFIYQPYNDRDMYKICLFHTNKLGIQITPKAVREIVNRSRGVPRLLVNSIDGIVDALFMSGNNRIDAELTTDYFTTVGIDSTGLTKTEIKMMLSLHETNGALGLDNLAIITNESPKNISQSIEPYLIRRGFMIRASKGRTITEKGVRYLEDSGHIVPEKGSKIQIDTSYKRQ